MCDSRVFLIRNFWKDERPTSTEYETATEHSFYPESETETEISELESDQPTETINDHVKNLELSKNEPRNENRMHEYKIKRLQEKIARWTTENGAAEDSRIQLENELSTCNLPQLKQSCAEAEIAQTILDLADLVLSHVDPESAGGAIELCDTVATCLQSADVADKFWET